MDATQELPEECLSLIISLTSPRDACTSSLVSHSFQSAADSDAVWDRFLPSDCLQIISDQAEDVSSLQQELSSLSKKQIFARLCRNPLLLNDKTLCFSLDKESGKKRYIIGARGLSITWGSTPDYWVWATLSESRFTEVAQLEYVWWFEVKGKFESKMLSPNTSYAAYLLFKFEDDYSTGFDKAVEASINFEGTERQKRRVFLQCPCGDKSDTPRDRGDGWMEIEMGKIFIVNGDNGSVDFSLQELGGYIKAGLFIEGIEFRPAQG
ncbi:hypothetical protein Tsubulata_029318 [Turnera subulata]|uniref:F-box domain-containing protein n=1 Tax=Turnera subulata TaxID=218843 RepID=A0A9Q0G238_9ROSI|nr:hypothetical protein Tsubulata_029318 [Turnera subulata]